MRRLAIVVGALLLMGLAAVSSWRQGATTLVDFALPAFPDSPQPASRLAADASGTLYFESATPFDLDVILDGMEHALPTTGVGTLYLPDGASPESRAPAMVLLHGSGGITPGREHETARWLSDHGIAGFVLDYYGPRGVTKDLNYMIRVLSVTEFDALTDAYGALRLLSRHPSINADRIGVMGFSYGGMATRFAMDERLREVLAPELPGFAAFADFYGPCFQDLRTRATNGAPFLTLRGTEDASNDLAACREREDALRGLGVEVVAHVYEGAGHAWEAESGRALRAEAPYVAGCTIHYDERGRSFIGDVGIVDVAPGTSRPERIALRIASSGPMRECVKSGYVIGRDDETRARAERDLLAFLSRVFES